LKSQHQVTSLQVTVNKVIVKDHFPLPRIEDQSDRLQDANTYYVHCASPGSAP